MWRPTMFLLCLIAAMAGSPLRQAEAAGDLALAGRAGRRRRHRGSRRRCRRRLRRDDPQGRGVLGTRGPLLAIDCGLMMPLSPSGSPSLAAKSHAGRNRRAHSPHIPTAGTPGCNASCFDANGRDPPRHGFATSFFETGAISCAKRSRHRSVPCLHLDRAAGRDRDHRHADRDALARRPGGARGGETSPVPQQSQADRAGAAQLSSRRTKRFRPATSPSLRATRRTGKRSVRDGDGRR